jgi:prevent-host-death family protein
LIKTTDGGLSSFFPVTDRNIGYGREIQRRNPGQEIAEERSGLPGYHLPWKFDKLTIDRSISRIISLFMATVSAFEAKTRFGELLDRVIKGEEIIITRHEKPVARIVPEGRRDWRKVRRAVAGLQELQSTIKLRESGRTRLTDAQVRSAIEEGRE